MMATDKLRARQESTDSLENSETLEEYSDDDKDLALEDFKFIKTIGEYTFKKKILSNFISFDLISNVLKLIIFSINLLFDSSIFLFLLF